MRVSQLARVTTHRYFPRSRNFNLVLFHAGVMPNHLRETTRAFRTDSLADNCARWPPRQTSRKGPSPTCAIAVFVAGALAGSRPFARSGRRRIGRAIRAASFDRTCPGAPRRTPFQRRGCGLPSDLLGPRGAFTGSRRSLTFSWVARGHARTGSVPSDALLECSSLPRRPS